MPYVQGECFQLWRSVEKSNQEMELRAKAGPWSDNRKFQVLEVNEFFTQLDFEWVRKTDLISRHKGQSFKVWAKIWELLNNKVKQIEAGVDGHVYVLKLQCLFK